MGELSLDVSRNMGAGLRSSLVMPQQQEKFKALASCQLVSASQGYKGMHRDCEE